MYSCIWLFCSSLCWWGLSISYGVAVLHVFIPSQWACQQLPGLSYVTSVAVTLLGDVTQRMHFCWVNTHVELLVLDGAFIPHNSQACVHVQLFHVFTNLGIFHRLLLVYFVVSTCISLMTSKIEFFHMIIGHVNMGDCSRFFTHFSIEFSVFFLVICKS